MLRVFGRAYRRSGGITRRELLRVGGLGFGGLTLPGLLRAQTLGGAEVPRNRSVVMIWLRGGPSHIDSYDMKPDAPPEIRGEFQPIATRIPGIHLCEYLPRHAQIIDKLAIVRGIRSNDIGDHTPHYIMTGSPDRGKRPAFGSVVSYLQQRPQPTPPYVSLMYEPPGLYDYEGPVYLGSAHRPFAPRNDGLDNLSLLPELSAERLRDRQRLVREFDRLSRAIDRAADAKAIDTFTQRAIDVVTSPNVRRAFDLGDEPPETIERYGKYCENLLLARRLVEAGVSVVTLKLGDWDTHEKNFRDMRDQLPQLDQGFSTFVNELHERGLQRDVAVVMWGEFGRAPQISRGDGRDHWPEAGAAVLAGGGFRTGQVIGATDKHGGRSIGTPYTPGNIMANLYQHLGIDPAWTIPDHNQRPIPLLDDPKPVRELI